MSPQGALDWLLGIALALWLCGISTLFWTRRQGVHTFSVKAAVAAGAVGVGITAALTLVAPLSVFLYGLFVGIGSIAVGYVVMCILEARHAPRKLPIEQALVLAHRLTASTSTPEEYRSVLRTLANHRFAAVDMARRNEAWRAIATGDTPIPALTRLANVDDLQASTAAIDRLHAAGIHRHHSDLIWCVADGRTVTEVYW